MKEEEEIMVSICCIAYNQEKFIADAIEGFLMQEVNFKYEILIHDDASQDGTADIIRSYEQKYPDLIKPIYQTVNQYSKGIKVSSAFNRPRAKGKYVAFCEGDDYWTDPRKLQIQFDCLENNPDVVCCYHGDYVLKDNILNKESRIAPEYRRSYTSYEMMTAQVHISTLTIFYRNLDIFKDYPHEAHFIKNGDTFLFSIMGQYGSGMYLPNIEPAIYRVHEGGIWSMKARTEQKSMTMNSWFWMTEYYARIGNKKIEDQFRMRYIIGSMAGVPLIRLIKIFTNITINYVVSPFKKFKDNGNKKKDRNAVD
jgi:glycosyltransferase involved in cell wall biosynthesis